MDKIKYSRTEAAILEVLRRSPKGKRITTNALAAVYRDRRAPIRPNQTVISTMTGLIEKVRRNGEGFVICRSERAGPVPIEFWRETT